MEKTVSQCATVSYRIALGSLASQRAEVLSSQLLLGWFPHEWLSHDKNGQYGGTRGSKFGSPFRSFSVRSEVLKDSPPMQRRAPAAGEDGAKDDGTWRTEWDTLGPIQVPAHRYWGAQTQRSLVNFPIGDPRENRMPQPLIRALGLIKRAAAQVNTEAGLLDPAVGAAVVRAADEVYRGTLDEHFPLRIWQTGSGTQTNMNANEVIANRATEILSGIPIAERANASGKGSTTTGPAVARHHTVEAASPPLSPSLHIPAHPPPFVHPNDHVNLCQSSNDTIPTAMHVAALTEVTLGLLPSLEHLEDTLAAKAASFEHVVKVGRTHLQDATPLRLGQEIGAYRSQVAAAARRIRRASEELYEVAQGGTAVGTGVNSFQGFDARIAARLAADLGLPIVPARDKFAALACHDPLVHLSGCLSALAAALLKIAGDIRLLGAGPRCGIAELRLPANEPGSSVMPGKVNPTQAEALVMVCYQVTGDHVTVTMAGASGHFELNACKPVIASCVLRSIRLLSDASRSFADRMVAGMEPDLSRISDLLDRSLMLATALAPSIGYKGAAAVANKAYAEGISLREAALNLGVINAENFDKLVQPAAMLQPKPLEEFRSEVLRRRAKVEAPDGGAGKKPEGE